MPELPDPLYVTNEAAALLRSNPRTLERWRTTGEGPTFVKLGRRVAVVRGARPIDSLICRALSRGAPGSTRRTAPGRSTSCGI